MLPLDRNQIQRPQLHRTQKTRAVELSNFLTLELPLWRAISGPSDSRARPFRRSRARPYHQQRRGNLPLRSDIIKVAIRQHQPINAHPRYPRFHRAVPPRAPPQSTTATTSLGLLRSVIQNNLDQVYQDGLLRRVSRVSYTAVARTLLVQPTSQSRGDRSVAEEQGATGGSASQCVHRATGRELVDQRLDNDLSCVL